MGESEGEQEGKEKRGGERGRMMKWGEEERGRIKGQYNDRIG